MVPASAWARRWVLPFDQLVASETAKLGHQPPKVALDVCGHLWPHEEDWVRDVIGRPIRADELRGAQG